MTAALSFAVLPDLEVRGMASGYDAVDLVCFEWARVRRQLLGLDEPALAREFLGALRCSLGNVQRHHDGAGSFTAREQQFPEVYTGDALLVNRAVKTMPPPLAAQLDLHYTLGRGAMRRAELLGIPRRRYLERLRAAKRRVESYLTEHGDQAA